MQGYDEVEFVADAEESDLTEMATEIGMPGGHAKALLRGWKKLQG